MRVLLATEKIRRIDFKLIQRESIRWLFSFLDLLKRRSQPGNTIQKVLPHASLFPAC